MPQTSPDVFSSTSILKYLTPLAASRITALTVLPEVSSTNQLLLQKAEDGAPEGTVILASAQTAGRGRSGRSFFSPKDTGIYLSLLLRENLDATLAQRVTPAAGVAACEAIEAVFGISPKIKWVNDVFLNRRKVCGILTEAAFAPTGVLNYAVLGIGINVYPPADGMPESLSSVAGWLTPQRSPESRSQLAAAFLNCFYPWYADLSAPTLMEAYRRYSLVIGKQITVHWGTQSYPGEAVDIDDTGHLLIRTEDGRLEALSSGEIRIRL